VFSDGCFKKKIYFLYESKEKRLRLIWENMWHPGTTHSRAFDKPEKQPKVTRPFKEGNW
jgi:hypothetical protein